MEEIGAAAAVPAAIGWVLWKPYNDIPHCTPGGEQPPMTHLERLIGGVGWPTCRDPIGSTMWGTVGSHSYDAEKMGFFFGVPGAVLIIFLFAFRRPRGLPEYPLFRIFPEHRKDRNGE